MLGVLLLGLITLHNQATGTALHSVLFAFAVTAHAALTNTTLQYICVCFTSKHKIIVQFYLLVFLKKNSTYHYLIKEKIRITTISCHRNSISIMHQHSRNATTQKSSIHPLAFSFVHLTMCQSLIFTECRLSDNTNTTADVSKSCFLH